MVWGAQEGYVSSQEKASNARFKDRVQMEEHPRVALGHHVPPQFLRTNNLVLAFGQPFMSPLSNFLESPPPLPLLRLSCSTRFPSPLPRDRLPPSTSPRATYLGPARVPDPRRNGHRHPAGTGTSFELWCLLPYVAKMVCPLLKGFIFREGVFSLLGKIPG